MNYFYIAKKSNYFAGWLNILGSVSWFLLMIAIYSYHFFLLIDASGAKNYQYLASIAPNDSTNEADSSTTNTIQTTPWYAYTYITKLGYSKFFSKTLFQLFTFEVTWWHYVRLLFVITIFCYVLKFFMSSFTLIASYKSKSMLYMYLSLMEMFLPFFGGLIVLYSNDVNSKVSTHKSILPLQWIKFKFKDFIWKIFNDSRSY